MGTAEWIAIAAAVGCIAFLVGLFIGAWQGHADALDDRDYTEVDPPGDPVPFPPHGVWSA